MNKDKEYIDGISSGLKAKPDLLGRTSVITAMSLEQPFVGRRNYLKIGIIPGSDLAPDAIFDLFIPGNFAYVRTDEGCSTIFGSRRYFQCVYEKNALSFVTKVTLT
jgi:hypothetical protein